MELEAGNTAGIANLSSHRIADGCSRFVGVIRAIGWFGIKANAFSIDAGFHHQVGVIGNYIIANIVNLDELTGGLAGAIAINIEDIDDQVLEDHQVTVAGDWIEFDKAYAEIDILIKVWRWSTASRID